ncbi:hypothetical protein [Mycobacterium sp. AZCC_0083]|uniref:hypothetical protein n=1 Tax=Mycobacterium sp. AZCC_0083 TaxID=2735882 RepID=UPI00161963AE|nr:hypothetical protein [Mycobacterium sp. AZCC_0083]MBB5163731.1 hypothetical protein [Mycobacterium sp. AZCC_0083]
MSIIGEWDVTIKTPIGSMAVVYSFTDDGSTVAGSATGKDETVPLRNIIVVNDAGGQRVTWQQSVTKPMRLNLDFDVVVDGDRLAGHSRAGRLPRSAVIGTRRRGQI